MAENKWCMKCKIKTPSNAQGLCNICGSKRSGRRKGSKNKPKEIKSEIDADK